MEENIVACQYIFYSNETRILICNTKPQIQICRATGKQCPWIAIRLPALLVEGIPQAPMNAEFHSAAARPLDAFSQAKNSPEYDF